VAFSFEQILLRAFATFQGALVKKNISLSHNILPTVPMRVIGDVHRMEHVMSNLISNAIKFSPEGKSVRVEILCDGYSRNDKDHEIANVTVSVEDEGAGISSEDQAKLFNSFVQIQPGTIQKGQGSGLGLSFCKQIVEFHGGAISVTSIEGSGSKFRFTIPFPVAPPSENQHSVAIPCEKQHTSRKESGCRPVMSVQSLIALETTTSAVKSMVDLEAQVLGVEKSPLLVLVVDDAGYTFVSFRNDYVSIFIYSQL
jgi:copper chaperone CopZ